MYIILSDLIWLYVVGIRAYHQCTHTRILNTSKKNVSICIDRHSAVNVTQNRGDDDDENNNNNNEYQVTQRITLQRQC